MSKRIKHTLYVVGVALAVGGIVQVAGQTTRQGSEQGLRQQSTASVYGQMVSAEQFVRHSHRVVIARVEEGVGARWGSPPHVFTLYKVRVERELGTDVVPSTQAQLVVILPGGRAEVGDGTWHEQLLRNYRMPLPGREYLLFLREVPDGQVPDSVAAVHGGLPMFSTLFSVGGVFDVQDRTAIARPAGVTNPSDGFVLNMLRRKVTTQQFIDRVDAEVRRQQRAPANRH